ncbi:unnamed protein product [Lepeophtheirus salmonis]|uniref:(salmon louse) hypothetical protein n=1 Tax=Lepeophtheirus salmonis TaxID=72036 RepID=A0A7R8CPM9_LEPSM|nr:unnamed protein product [Lepeophtheirus salmonis]CAF2887727.1 unnamed protein product [Lepeophtheirus salmonis]
MPTKKGNAGVFLCFRIRCLLHMNQTFVVLQICPCGANICQLRLDFISFAILPPDNGNSGVIGRILNGAPTSKANGLEVTSSTRCNSESFSVSNPSGTTPPVICGMNDGYHMYVDTNNPLDFQLSGPGTMALTDDNICCNYDFNLKLGFDCLIIPTATSFANEKQLNANYFCGASKGLGAVGSRTAANTGIVRPNSLPNKSICL